MRFSDIAVRNLRRRRGRTVFLILSLSVGAALMVAGISVTNAMRVNAESRLREFGANMVVMPKSVEMPLTYGGVGVASVGAPLEELTEDDATLIASIERNDTLRGVSPKLVSAITLDTREFMLVGVNFRDELKMKPWWHITGEPPSLSRDLLLGATTAAQLHKKPGDTVSLQGKEFRVTGTLDEQYSAEDRAVFADLRETGLILNKPGKVSVIEVSTWCADCPIETVIQQISAKLPNARVSAVKQIVEAELAQVRLMTTFTIALTGIALLVGALITLLTVMASVRERTQEIGILRAIGFRREHITKIIVLEGLVVSLAGGVAGAVVGSVAAIFLSLRLGGLPSLWVDPRIIIGAILLAVIMGTLPTLYPARQAAKLDPVAALKMT